MAKAPKKDQPAEGDPKKGDELLKRMLRTKPKQHADMIAQRKARRPAKQGKPSR